MASAGQALSRRGQGRGLEKEICVLGWSGDTAEDSLGQTRIRLLQEITDPTVAWFLSGSFCLRIHALADSSTARAAKLRQQPMQNWSEGTGILFL